MLSQPEHTRIMFETISTNLDESIKMPPDLSFLCTEGKMVHSHKSLFTIFSPLLRSVLSSLQPAVSSLAVVTLPDVSSTTLELAIRMLSRKWDKNVMEISEDLANALKSLGIIIEKSINDRAEKNISYQINSEISVNSEDTNEITEDEKNYEENTNPQNEPKCKHCDTIFKDTSAESVEEIA